MSLLVDRLQDFVVVDGKKIKIATSFRLWLLYFKCLNEQNSIKINIALRCICPTIPITEEVLVELKKFAFLGETPTEQDELAAQGPVYFELFTDEQLIVADFAREYHIDLLDPELDMHWYKFKILLDNLSDRSCVSARIRLRQIPLKDVSKKERTKVRKAKEKYKIKSQTKKMTLEQRNQKWLAWVERRSHG